MEDLDFNQTRKIVLNRYVSGLSDMSEILEFAKIEILNDLDNCLGRLIKLGYIAIKKEDFENSEKVFEVLDTKTECIYKSELTLAKTRYLTGKTKDLKEVLAVIKLIITQDYAHSAKRLDLGGYVVIADPKYQTIDKDNDIDENVFADILG